MSDSDHTRGFSPYTIAATIVACVIMLAGLVLGIDLRVPSLELGALVVAAAAGGVIVGAILPAAIWIYQVWRND